MKRKISKALEAEKALDNARQLSEYCSGRCNLSGKCDCPFVEKETNECIFYKDEIPWLWTIDGEWLMSEGMKPPENKDCASCMMSKCPSENYVYDEDDCPFERVSREEAENEQD